MKVHLRTLVSLGPTIEILQWLNQQHIGRPDVPVDMRVPVELRQAHEWLRCGYPLSIGCTLLKDGTVTAETLTFNGITYRLTEDP